MERTGPIWELARRLLAEDPDQDAATLAMAHVGKGVALLEQCDPAKAEAIRAAIKDVIEPRTRTKR